MTFYKQGALYKDCLRATEHAAYWGLWDVRVHWCQVWSCCAGTVPPDNDSQQSRPVFLYDLNWNNSIKWWQQLASCLINAQPLPAHHPAADDNSLIGCTSHDLTDDWSLASMHFVDSQYTNFGAVLGAFFYRTRFIWPQCTVRQYYSDLSD